MNEIIELLKNQCSDTGSASDKSINLVLEKYGKCIPEDLLQLFSNITGDKGIEIEHVFFNGPENYKPVNEYLHDVDKIEGGDSYFAIADYDGWCWGYVINVNETNNIPVFMTGPKEDPLIQVADSLEEFIKMCIVTDPRLWG